MASIEVGSSSRLKFPNTLRLWSLDVPTNLGSLVIKCATSMETIQGRVIFWEVSPQPSGMPKEVDVSICLIVVKRTIIHTQCAMSHIGGAKL